ncbi:MAG: UDP-N-acetylmuramate dehydrogenase [Myxococcales bacterium]|nr:UDP-N-acetylmuramate dehydrogenase [Myxococcales bacterium]USN51302.1 MAG: UDP-N-acetylmuramate dehydrogenase [Myxococcales bacterium]
MISFALKHLLDKLSAKREVALAPFSTLKVGGPARFFVEARNNEELALLQKACLEHNLPLHILSGGSNTLFSDNGFDGLVIKLGSQFDFLHCDKKNQALLVGAATSYAKVTKQALLIGIDSAVGWSGIPGLIGGALRMNAGTSMGEIGDVVDEIYAVQNGEKVIFTGKDLKFSYRSNNLPKDIIITGARLKYKEESLKSSEVLLQKVQEYRLKRKKTQPIINSLGSFFKNPYPLFAAQLIESCQLKGLQYQQAQISSLHANFIINNGGAKANDILYIGSTAQQKVFEQHSVALQPEILLVGNFKDSPSIDPKRFFNAKS